MCGVVYVNILHAVCSVLFAVYFNIRIMQAFGPLKWSEQIIACFINGTTKSGYLVIQTAYSFTFMSMKIKAPAYKESNYERYHLELMAWQEITGIPEEKQGIAIALSLPEETECSIHEKIFDKLSIT